MFLDKRLKVLLADAKATKAKIQSMRDAKKYDATYIMQTAQNEKVRIKEQLSKFYSDKQAELHEKVQEIKDSYNQSKYVNPLHEVLRRQDIETRYKVMTQDQLKDELNDFIQNGLTNGRDVLSVNLLQIELQGRRMEKEETKLRSYRNAHNVDHPFLANEEYVQAQTDLNSINMVKKSNLIMYGPSGDRETFRVDDI